MTADGCREDDSRSASVQPRRLACASRSRQDQDFGRKTYIQEPAADPDAVPLARADAGKTLRHDVENVIRSWRIDAV